MILSQVCLAEDILLTSRWCVQPFAPVVMEVLKEYWKYSCYPAIKASGLLQTVVDHLATPHSHLSVLALAELAADSSKVSSGCSLPEDLARLGAVPSVVKVVRGGREKFLRWENTGVGVDSGSHAGTSTGEPRCWDKVIHLVTVLSFSTPNTLEVVKAFDEEWLGSLLCSRSKIERRCTAVSIPCLAHRYHAAFPLTGEVGELAELLLDPDFLSDPAWQDIPTLPGDFAPDARMQFWLVQGIMLLVHSGVDGDRTHFDMNQVAGHWATLRSTVNQLVGSGALPHLLDLLKGPPHSAQQWVGSSCGPSLNAEQVTTAGWSSLG